MERNYQETLNIIFKHKEYFDEKLVYFVDLLKKRNDKLSEKINKLKFDNDKLSNDLSTYQNATYLLSDKIKHKDKEIDDLKDDIKKLIKEMEEMKKDNDRLKDEIIKTIKDYNISKKENERLNKKIKKLERSNSLNSNLPSSYDILSHTKSVSNSRKRSPLARGAKKGHIVHISKLHKPDKIINLNVKKIPQGALLRKDTNDKPYYVTQVIDLKLNKYVKEYHYQLDPNGIELDDNHLKSFRINPLIYSSHFKSMILYLNQKGTIPFKRLHDILYELTAIDLKEASIVNWNREFAIKAKDKKEAIFNDIILEKLVHVDETSFKLNGSNIWLHDISNSRGTYILATNSRFEEDGPITKLKDYKDYLVHDHFKSYYRLDAKHCECNAHIDRYLRSAYEFDDTKIAKDILDLLHKAKDHKEDLIKKGQLKMKDEDIGFYKGRLLAYLDEGLNAYYTDNKDIPKKYEPDYVKLFKRMKKYLDEHLRFITDFKVPYTNNEAERQCRIIKTKKNSSHQFVSFDMAKSYATFTSIIQTAKKRKQNVLKSIEDILSQ